MGSLFDITKVVVGSFFGAGFAFFLNWKERKNTLRNDNLAAATRAMFTIRAQLDDFINYRYGTLQSYDYINSNNAPMPLWAYGRPVSSIFHESNSFDYKSLGFLLLKPSGRIAFQRLQYTDRVYRNLMIFAAEFNANAQEMQKKIEALPPIATTFDAEKHIGAALIGKLNDQVGHISTCLLRDEAKYRRAFDELNDAIADFFGEAVKIKALQFAQIHTLDHLPKMPLSIQQYVDAVPVLIDD